MIHKFTHGNLFKILFNIFKLSGIFIIYYFYFFKMQLF